MHAAPTRDARGVLAALERGFVGGNTLRYKAFDDETHDNAAALAGAARSSNGEEAIMAFRRLQSTCLACHQMFRKPLQKHFYGKANVR